MRKKIRVIETEPASVVASSQFPAWVAEAFNDLSAVLMIGGLSIPYHQFSSMMKRLFGLAYHIRVALAEKDICGVELVVEGPGTPFHPSWMDEAHTPMRNGTVRESSPNMERIVGTTGVGLKRTAKAAKNCDEYPYLLKPKVVKARVLWNNES